MTIACKSNEMTFIVHDLRFFCHINDSSALLLCNSNVIIVFIVILKDECQHIKFFTPCKSINFNYVLLHFTPFLITVTNDLQASGTSSALWEKSRAIGELLN